METTHQEESTIQEKLVLKKEAARVLRVSESTIDNYRRRGILKGYTTPGGRVVLFKKSDLFNLLQETA